ncbi:MAG: hypothetical protein ACO27Q_01435 [Bacteroidia bacterium]
MIKSIAIRLRHNWNAWRILRLVCGLFFAVHVLLVADTIVTVSGLFIVAHALWNPCNTCTLPKR